MARLLRDECPEELKRGNGKDIISALILTCLKDADEAEALGRGSTDREVTGHVLHFEALVIRAAINDLPRALASVM